MTDRAEDGDGGADAVRPARNRSADAVPDAASPGGGGAPRDPALTGTAERAAARRRYRDLVDDAYGTARGAQAQDAQAQDAQAQDAQAEDAWAEALPELRDAWGKHEEKYQERSRPAPRPQPDGGWEADGNRRLNPDQNAEASRACADVRKEGKDVILPAMERIEAADPSRRLAGLDHMLKGEDRLKEKIAERLRYDPDWTAKQALGEVPDTVRFTLAYSDNHYTAGVRADVDRLKEEGFELVKLKNLWTKEQYKGINSQWCVPESGARFEVQFHTPTGFQAKELTHGAYERLRNPETSADEEVRLEGYQRRVTAQVPIPPNVFEIEDYPPERRDG